MRGWAHRLARLLAAVSWVWVLPAPAATETLEAAALRLRGDHQAFVERIEADPRKLPFTVEAVRDQGTMRSLSRFLLEVTSFDALLGVLASQGGWCESLLLHLNVKTCVFRNGAEPRLELYLGRKHYQEPGDSVRIAFLFDSKVIPGAMRATLTADAGPYGTSQYEFILNAVAVGDDVFVELQMSNEEGYAGRLLDLYLNTLGRQKVGFSLEGETLFGNPRYVTGQIAAAERNVVRYMYALRVSVEYRAEPFMQRAGAWFDATERHARQLHELERSAYLDNKQQEYLNQIAYQQALDHGTVVETPLDEKNR
jgi:hypothetical protein